MPSTTPTSLTGLYWNTRGNIRCEEHILDIDDQKWLAEAWAPIPQHEEPVQRQYQCQRCAGDGNAIRR
jgi:hypothetical protein